MGYLNRKCLNRISSESFRKEKPYPWASIEDTMMPEAFERLAQTFPDLSFFPQEPQNGSAFGQVRQARAISPYRQDSPLPPVWKEFVAELEGEFYESFLRRMFELPAGQPLLLSMEWHYAWQGCAVSPHCDAPLNLGRHIFYFNTESEWDAKWGGEILILDDLWRLPADAAPRFEDLQTAAVVDPRGNGSLIFRSTDHSWHGIRPLESPPRRLRKLFVVTVNAPAAKAWWSRVRRKAASGDTL